MLEHMEFNASYDCLMHAVALDPQCAETWATLGALYLARGQPADAVVAFEHGERARDRSKHGHRVRAAEDEN